jgi:hypothetical protein
LYCSPHRQHVPHFHLLILVNAMFFCVWFRILEASQQIYVLRRETESLTPNPQPGEPGYPVLSGSEALTCLADDAKPLVSLQPAQLLG